MKVNKIIANKAFSRFAAVFCTLLWGTAFPFIKQGYAAFGIAEEDIGSKLVFAGLRFGIAGCMALVLLWIRERKLSALTKDELRPVVLLGAVQTFAQYLFTYIGIGFTSGTNTSIITACASFFTVLAVPLFFKSDRLTMTKAAGCALGFAGVLVINQGGGINSDTLLGDSLILLSTICAASGNIISKKIARGRNPIRITAFQLIIGAAALLASGFVCGGTLSIKSPECILILLWLAFVSAASFTVWTALLKYHPASKITVFNLLVPVFGTVLSGIMLGENVFRAETMVSLALISAGIIAVNVSDGQKELNVRGEKKN